MAEGFHFKGRCDITLNSVNNLLERISIMKKKIAALLLAVSVMAMMTGCGGKKMKLQKMTIKRQKAVKTIMQRIRQRRQILQIKMET